MNSLAVLAVLAFGQPASPSAPAGSANERSFEVTIGIRLKSSGDGQRYTAGTPVPIDWPEQRAELLAKETVRCSTKIRDLGRQAAILVMSTAPLARGQEARVLFRYRVTIRATDGLPSEDFEAVQPKTSAVLRPYLLPSPGVESDDPEIRTLAAELAQSHATDWDKLREFFRWVHERIEYRVMDFTSARAAARDRIGDCEEKAALFVALARSIGVPARTVWTKGHCWAEFYLVDGAGTGHWLPAHTSGPAWFGYLPVPNVILAKGDRFEVSGSGLPIRHQIPFWHRGSGAPAQVEFIQEIRPLDPDNVARPMPGGTP